MMKKKLTKLITLVIINLITLYTHSVIATEYDIGPSQSLTSLDEVPWLDLQAGDKVNIHYQATPYRTKIGLHGRGTKQDPIVIRGIKGPNGELPTISGKDATTPANLNGFFSEKWDENLAVFLIKRARSDSYFDYKPGHITIENLKIVGAFNGNTFTDSNGNIRNYSNGAGGIWAVLVEDLIVRNCEITGNGNGLFILSKSDENNISRNILVEKNRIYDNGVPDSDRQHNIYTQAATITFQYNEIGQLRNGAKGSSLKDRSSNTTIRFNKIESSARALDLVDPEDGGNVIAFEPGFHETYVYGNLILNDHSNKQKYASGNMIHYGGDSGLTDLYRKGKLHFYNNTVVIKANKNDIWRVRLFDLATNEETVVLQNNILYRQGDTNFLLMNNHGIAEVEATNWISQGWQEGREGSFDGSVNQLANGFIESDNHCFVNVENDNYLLRSGSSCVNSGVALANNLPILNAMYKSTASKLDRTILGNFVDLGAFEGEVQTENDEPTTPEAEEPSAPPVEDNTDTDTDNIPAPTSGIYQIKIIAGQYFSFNMADVNNKTCRQGYPDYPKIKGLPAGVYRSSGCSIFGKGQISGVSRISFPVEDGEWSADLVITGTDGVTDNTNLPETDADLPDSPQIEGTKGKYFSYNLEASSDQTCRQGYPDYPKVIGLPAGIYRSGCNIYGRPENSGTSELTFPVEGGQWVINLVINE